MVCLMLRGTESYKILKSKLVVLLASWLFSYHHPKDKQNPSTSIFNPIFTEAGFFGLATQWMCLSRKRRADE